MFKLSQLKPNPNNPRTITGEKLRSLKRSIQDFEKMMELRPIIYDEKGEVLGGNMRLQALKALDYKEVPESWVKLAAGLSEEEKRQFIIKDNVGFGAWDWELLANEWDSGELLEWGLEVPTFLDSCEEDEPTDTKAEKPYMKITFEEVEHLQDSEKHIIELISRKYKGAFYNTFNC